MTTRRSPAAAEPDLTIDVGDGNGDHLPGADVVDDPNGVPRQTTTLLAALLTRSATLGVISGAQTMASLAAGLAALGREASTTIEGQQLRQSIACGRVAQNLDLLFTRLGFGNLASKSPPTPMLEDFRNDLALLLSPDVADVVDAAVVGAATGTATGRLRQPVAVDPIDFVVGLWTFSREVVAALDALATSVGSIPPSAFVSGALPSEPGSGRLLR